MLVLSRRAFAACSVFASADRTDFVIIAGLAAYLLLGPFQLFPPPGWVDPALYIGYFRHLDMLVDRYGPTYFVNRWPLVLLGKALYYALPMQAANAALAATWYVAVLLALRAILRAVSPVIRKLVLILYGCSPLVVASVSRSYADGPTIALLMLAMASAWTGIGTGTPSRPRLFAAGALAATALLTQPGSLFAFLPMAMALLVVERGRAAEWLPAALGWGLGGGVAGTALYVAVIRLVTGTADLFGPLLANGDQFLHAFGSNYREPLSDWVFPTTRLSFVVLTLAAGLWTAWRGGAAAASPPLRRLFLWSLLSTAGSLSMLAASDILLGNSMLQFPFYASYLLPGTFLLLGTLLAVWALPLSPNGHLVLLAAAAVLGTIVVTILMRSTAHTPPSAALFPILVAGCTVVVALAAGWGTRARSVWPLVLLLAALCPLAAVSVDTRHVYRGRAGSFADTYAVLARAADVIDTVALKRPILFWFDRDGFNQAITAPRGWSTPNREVYPLRFGPARFQLNALDSLNAFYLWEGSQLNDSLPQLNSSHLATLGATSQPFSIVVVSYRAADIDQAVEALSRAGIDVRRQDRHTIQGKSLTLQVGLLDVGG